MADIYYEDIADIIEKSTSKFFEGEVNTTNFHVEFNTVVDDLTVHVDNGDILKQEVYGRAADFVFTSGTKYVVIEGVELKQTSELLEYPVQDDGEIDTEENVLITSNEMADRLAQHTIDYLKLRRTYSTDYRGNPELEALDEIGIQTYYVDSIDGLVLVHNLNFNGGLSGSVVVKRLKE